MDTLVAPIPAGSGPDGSGPRGRGPFGRGGLIALVTAGLLLLLAGGWALAQVPPNLRTVADPVGPGSPQTRGTGNTGNTGDIGDIGKVRGQSAKVHLEALQRIADANGGNRAAGTPGYTASVAYVVGVLQKAGLDVRTEEFTYTDRDESRTDVNVIAQTRTGDPAHVVMAGAHLDSVPDGPGINDNATGVAALLEIATRLGGSPALPDALRFGFWGAEEPGQYGSAAYVAGLAPAERQGLTYLNLDMIASPNGGYFVQGGVGDDLDETGPPGSADLAKVLVEELAAAGVTAETSAFDDRSDVVAFLQAGVPTAGLHAGDRKRKSDDQVARWGGTEDEPFDHCYHDSCDTIANVDATAFDRCTRATAAALVALAAARR